MTSTGTLHVHCEQLNGAAALGSVKITVNTSDQQVRDPAGNIVFSGPITVGLVAGEATMTLPATDDATLSPTNFTYTLEEQLKHVARDDYRRASFQLVTGGTVHSADIASDEEIAEDPSYGANLNSLTTRVEALEEGAVTDAITSTDVHSIAVLTAAEYADIDPGETGVLYVVTGA